MGRANVLLHPPKDGHQAYQPPPSRSALLDSAPETSTTGGLSFAAVLAAGGTRTEEDTKAANVRPREPVVYHSGIADHAELALLAGYRMDAAGYLEPVPNWEKIEQKMCRKYLSGSCTFGDKCRFVHVNRRK